MVTQNMITKDVPLDLCEPDERFLYRTSYDDVSDLANSIATWGQLESAIGWEDPATGKCYIVAGIRRLKAARIAKEKYGHPTTLRVSLVPADAPKNELWMIALEENLRRRNLTDIEVTRIARWMISNDIINITKLDELLNPYDAKTVGYIIKLISNITDEELEDFALAESWAKSSGTLLGKQYLRAYHLIRLLGQERYYRLAGAYFALVNDWRPDDDPVERVRYMRSVKLVVMLAPIEQLMYKIGVQPPEGGWITPSLQPKVEKKKPDTVESVLSRAGPAREASEEALKRAKPPAPSPSPAPPVSESVKALERAAPPRAVAPEASSRGVEAGPAESKQSTPERGPPVPEEAPPTRERMEETPTEVTGATRGEPYNAESPEEEATEAARGAGSLAQEAQVVEETRVFGVLLEAGVDEFDVTCPYCGRKYHIEIIRSGSV